MKKFGFGKKDKSASSAPAAAANPYAAQPQPEADPYAQEPKYANMGAANPSPYQAARQGLPSGPGRGGLPGGPGAARGPAPPANGGGYGASKYGSGGGYGANRFDGDGAAAPATYGGGGGGGYGGLGRTNSNDTTTTEDQKDALFGGAKDRYAQKQPPPSNGQPGGYGAPPAAGGYGGGAAYGAERQLTAEEEEEEDVAATKQQIRFMKQSDVSSTRNALRIAQQAEESGRATLARLGAQGERIHNTEKNLDLAASHNRVAEEKAKELKTLNRSMFAVHVANPFTSGSRREERDAQIVEKHRMEREQRDATRQAAFASQQRMEGAFKDVGDAGYKAPASKASLAERSKYQFEADSEDEDMENEIDANLDALSGAAGRLNLLARATGREVDEQNKHIEQIIQKVGNCLLISPRGTLLTIYRAIASTSRSS